MRSRRARITRSRDGVRGAADDDERVDDVVFRAASIVLAIAFASWLALLLAIVASRARYDRRVRGRREQPLSDRTVRRLVRRASKSPRTEWGRWRRVRALQQLARAHHPAVPGLIRPVLEDPDPMIAAAAIRTLGDLGDDRASDVLLAALQRGEGPRSRIAAELERLAPAPGEKLLPLLFDWSPDVRFWAATLLRPYPRLGEPELVELTWDPDPNVRAAAVETLGSRSGSVVEAALLARLDDSEWFVRVHAARAAGQVLGAGAARSIARLLADERWWVRTAAKDALRAIGTDAVPTLLPMLGHEDRFARNGAAEVLQDVGFVDFLALDQADSPLLERIYDAGGERFREAAEARTVEAPETGSEERGARAA